LHQFTYDALLRRHAVQDSGGLSYFTWDSNGMNLLCERDASGSTTAYYTHGYTSTDGIGSLVATKREEAGASYYQYPICDAIKGNVVRLVDENGTPVAYYEYDAWGNDLRDDIVGGIGTNRFRYQSNWIQLTDDPNNVLKLTPTRLYHAGVGRFLGRDPLLRLGGHYSYAETLLTKAVDPRGRRVFILRHPQSGGSNTRKVTLYDMIRYAYAADCSCPPDNDHSKLKKIAADHKKTLEQDFNSRAYTYTDSAKTTWSINLVVIATVEPSTSMRRRCCTAGR